MRRALAIAATSFALLATGCSSDTSVTDTPTAEAAAAEAPAARTTQAPLPVIKGAPQNGGGIVYHRSNCGYNNVRWYGAGGEGPGQACGTWSLPAYQRDIIHSFDWNFRTEDLSAIHRGWFEFYQDAASTQASWPSARRLEVMFFDAVDTFSGRRGNAYTDLINNNLPGHSIGDGQATPGRWR
jgi:hypothetical protein